eukprot:220749_1
MIELLQNIVHNRFHCSMQQIKNKKAIAIWYGKWNTNKKSKKLMYMREPNKILLHDYYLQSLCRNRQIDGICRQIKTEYKLICAKNKKLLKKMNRKYQLFCWGIMVAAIKKIIPNQVWKWLKKIDNNNNNNNNDIPIFFFFFICKIYIH